MTVESEGVALREDQGFINDVLASPDDDVHRLIYADWLEENGQDERADFIRTHIEYNELHGHFAEHYERGCDKCERAYRAQQKLVEKYRPPNHDHFALAGDDCPSKLMQLQVLDGRCSWEWHRGFVRSLIGIRVIPLLKSIERLRQRHPIAKVSLSPDSRYRLDRNECRFYDFDNRRLGYRMPEFEYLKPLWVDNKELAMLLPTFEQRNQWHRQRSTWLAWLSLNWPEIRFSFLGDEDGGE